MSDSTAEAAAAPAPPAYPGSETLEQTIERIQKAADTAKAAKETADSRFAELDGHLTALRNLQRESDQAEQAYKAAYDRLTIDQQDFHDYYESEKESLEHLLGKAGVDAVCAKAEAKDQKDEDTASAVTTAKSNLAAAQETAATAETIRKAKAATVDQLKRLAATIGAEHTTLKGRREDVVKARQGGKYALAYWLLVYRDFDDVLAAVADQLIKPDTFPACLLDAVNELAEAEAAKAAADNAVAKCQADLAEAQRKADLQKANGEKDLRAELETIPAAAY